MRVFKGNVYRSSMLKSSPHWLCILPNMSSLYCLQVIPSASVGPVVKSSCYMFELLRFFPAPDEWLQSLADTITIAGFYESLALCLTVMLLIWLCKVPSRSEFLEMQYWPVSIFYVEILPFKQDIFSSYYSFPIFLKSASGMQVLVWFSPC